MDCLKLSYFHAAELKIISSKKVLTSKKSKNKVRSGYMFGFNGQEKVNEMAGVGNFIDYKERGQDTRIARFLSVDPISSKFPMLTPFQFASNNPIMNVDIDGLEGISYRATFPFNGLQILIARVIETDVYVAVNDRGLDGAYKTKEFSKLQTRMNTKFNQNGYVDEGGLPVIFQFNFKAYDPTSLKNKHPEKNDVKAKKDFANRVADETSIRSNFTVKGTIDAPVWSTKGVVMWKQDLGDPNERGINIGNINKINPNRAGLPFGRTENHEMTHFLLQNAGFSNQSPNATTNKDHDLGGWMIQGDKSKNELSPEAARKIIEAVPRVNDRVLGSDK